MNNNLKNQPQEFRDYFSIDKDGGLICSAPFMDLDTINLQTLNAVTENIINKNDYEITGFVRATGDITANFGELNQVSMTDLNTQIITANSNISSNSSLIDILNGQMITANSNISSNSNLIDILNGQIITANSNISSNSSLIDILNGQIITANSNISSNSSLIDILNGQMITANSNISSNSSLLDTKLDKAGGNITGNLSFRNAQSDDVIRFWPNGNVIPGVPEFDMLNGIGGMQQITAEVGIFDNLIVKDDGGIQIPIYTAATNEFNFNGATVDGDGLLKINKLDVEGAYGNQTINGDTGAVFLGNINASSLDASFHLGLPTQTDAQMNSGTPQIGYTIFNTTQQKIFVYTQEGWIPSGSSLENPIYTQPGTLESGINEYIQIQEGLKIGQLFDQERTIPEYNGTVFPCATLLEIQSALSNAITGDVIMITANIDLSTTLTITKRIKLTALTPDLYISLNFLNFSTITFNSDDLLIQGITIKSLGTGSNESCVLLNDTTAINNYIDNCTFICDEFGVISSNNQIQITNCRFEYARYPAGESQRYIGLLATQGNTFISDNTFVGSSLSANGSQCISTAGGTTANFINGKVYIKNNKSIGPVQRLLMNEISLIGTNVNFYFIGNEMITSSGFVIFYQSPGLGGVDEIWLINNTETLLTANTGKGLIGLDFPSGTNTINTNVKIYSRNNISGALRGDYSNASIPSGVLAYATARFTAPAQLFQTEYLDNVYVSQSIFDPNGQEYLSEIPSGIDSTKIADGSVSNTEFQYLDGVTSGIQTQLNDKVNTSFFNGIVTQVVKGNGVIESLSDTDLPTAINANKIANGLVSNTEFQYLDGVTSGIQTQLDGKLNITGGTILQDLIISGNLTVNGSQTIIDSNITSVNQLFISAGVGTSPALDVSATGTGNIMRVHDLDDATKFVIDNSCRIALNKNTADYSLDLGSVSDAIALPKGTTLERPSGLDGLLRFNTTINDYEGFKSGDWTILGAGGGGDFNPMIDNLFLGDAIFYDGVNWRNGYYTVAPVVSVVGNDVSVGNLVSPYIWNGGTGASIQMRIFVYTDAGRTNQITGSPFVVNSNTKSFTVGTGQELEDGVLYYLSVQVRPNIAAYPNSYSPFTNATLTAQGDVIEANLTGAELTNYQNAPIDNWVAITQTQYNAINSALLSKKIYSTFDGVPTNGRVTNTLYHNVNNFFTFRINERPVLYRIYGSGQGATSYIYESASQTSLNSARNRVPVISNSQGLPILTQSIHYYVRKKPTFTFNNDNLTPFLHFAHNGGSFAWFGIFVATNNLVQSGFTPNSGTYNYPNINNAILSDNIEIIFTNVKQW